MKLEQLKINGFGILNDLAIDFEPDLTVIYGLNGSGKSTLLNFLRSVLYGFYHRGSPRRYEPLRGGSHGGSIVISEGGQRYLLSRVGDRRSGGVLIIEDLQTGVSLPEEHVQRLIGGISQSLFETVYAFGLSELQQLKFIQDQDLSALLYSIGLGADISLADIYDSLDTAMDSIYKSRGSKPELNRIQALLVENSARIKAMSGITRQYQELTAEIEAKRHEAAKLRRVIEEKETELQRINIMLEVWPQWQKLLVAREKLQHLPELSLPENGLARLKALQGELKAVEEKLYQAKAKLPVGTDQELETRVDINQLKLEFDALAVEFEQMKPQLDVAAERHREIQNDCAVITNEIAALEAQVSELGFDKASPDDLSVKKQWLEGLKTAYANPEAASRTIITIVQLVAVCGWLLIGVLFLFRRISEGVWLSIVIAALLLLLFGKEQLSRQKEAHQRAKRIDELAARLGIDSTDEIAVLEGRIAKAEELYKELEQQKRNLQHSQAKLAAGHQNLIEKQKQMDKVLGKLRELLKHCCLPEHFGISELRLVVDVLERLPEHRARHEEIKRELEEIYSSCRTSNHEEIARLYQIQTERRELMHDVENLEIVLRTTLGSQITQWEELLKSATKAELAREKGQLEAEIGRLTASLDELQEVLGGLNAKREMLQHSQQLEELQLEQEMLRAKALNLATKWTSMKICRWAIEQVSRKYELERQPEVLKLASRYFAAITEGRYQRVYAPIGMQEVKIETADGEVLSPPQLSQGTVEQLYLAIRFALAVQIAREKVEIPLFADDILVNFDHFRLVNTVDLMKELSRQHQIILLTCHQRIADLFDSRHVRHLDETAAELD